MSGKALKFDYYIKVNKKEFHCSKQSIGLNLADINKLVISSRFKHSGDGFKYLLATKKILSLDLYILFCLKCDDT